MTHLRIELNNGQIEQVGSAVIRKLYELAIEGLDATSNLQGRLHVINSYRKYITKLTTDYPNLYITADNYYMAFDDPAVESIFANGDYGDGVGITEVNANRITKLSSSSGFRNNKSIEYFDELSLFINLKTIEPSTFTDCSNLKTIDLSNITSLSANVFLNCSNLTSMGDISNITVYGDDCLRNCSSLDISLDLSDVTYLGNRCFKDSLNIDIAKLPQNLCTFGEYMFFNSGIKNVLIPAWMTSVPNYFLDTCKKLETVTFAQNLQMTSIGNRFITADPLIQQIVLPEGVLTIGTHFGNSCLSLTLIDLPSTVTSIGLYAGSGNVTTFICRATTPPTLAGNIRINGNGKIYVPDQSIADYKAASNWSNNSSKIVGISQL